MPCSGYGGNRLGRKARNVATGTRVDGELQDVGPLGEERGDRAAPVLGADTAAVLGELGYSAAEIDTLKAKRVV